MTSQGTSGLPRGERCRFPLLLIGDAIINRGDAHRCRMPPPYYREEVVGGWCPCGRRRRTFQRFRDGRLPIATKDARVPSSTSFERLPSSVTVFETYTVWSGSALASGLKDTKRIISWASPTISISTTKRSGWRGTLFSFASCPFARHR